MLLLFIESSVLVLAANADAPDALLELNERRNAAVVSVEDLRDYPKLEDAVAKLARLIYKRIRPRARA